MTCEVITRMLIQAKTPSTLSEYHCNSTNEAEEWDTFDLELEMSVAYLLNVEQL